MFDSLVGTLGAEIMTAFIGTSGVLVYPQAKGGLKTFDAIVSDATVDREDVAGDESERTERVERRVVTVRRRDYVGGFGLSHSVKLKTGEDQNVSWTIERVEADDANFVSLGIKRRYMSTYSRNRIRR